MVKVRGQFYDYKPPYRKGAVLTFPNDPACGAVKIEKLGTGSVVNWNGRAGDTVRARAGTIFRPLQGPVNYTFTLGEDGWLTFLFSPAKG
jgi:hypothetical protein